GRAHAIRALLLGLRQHELRRQAERGVELADEAAAAEDPVVLAHLGRERVERDSLRTRASLESPGDARVGGVLPEIDRLLPLDQGDALGFRLAVVEAGVGDGLLRRRELEVRRQPRLARE